MTEMLDCQSWLRSHLVCPRDRKQLSDQAGSLRCEDGHRYPIVDGVPVLLVDDVSQTIESAQQSLAHTDQRAPGLYLESVSISEDEKQGVVALAAKQPAVDAVVAYLVAATNGLMYRHLIGKLERYPIPQIDLPAGEGRVLLDVGCSWGRWTLAASARGYRAVGIDPSLGAVMAARRVARQLNVPAAFAVADARYLPFAGASIDTVFSYSVIQHFSREAAAEAVAEIGRVLKPGGTARVQMPTRYGLRCLYHQVRRGFSDGEGFDVRYWRRRELVDLFSRRVGPTTTAVEGFFGIGLQSADADLMTAGRRLVLHASNWLTRASTYVPLLARAADSVYVDGTKR